ncbi:MAG TPA: glycerophosphodiester phosphodiesterase [Myxococcota bacterium]|nr:glycerophosphodiester phosphodiesterase [Myxococcota bacterium]
MAAHDTVQRMPHLYFEVPRPIVIGHRGAAGERPENTLASFARGLEAGAAILESDLHLTRDGVVVMAHDATVDRTTNGSGALCALTSTELSKLDAGYRFSPDGGRSFPFRGQGLRIPTLEEGFQAFPNVRFNLELKLDEPALVERTVALVEREGRAAITLLTAEGDALMARLRAHLRARGVAVAVGAAAGDVLHFVRAALDARPPPPEPMALQVPASFAGRPLVTRELVAHAHAYGVQVHVWTVNDPPEMERLLDLGVDGLVTDFPERMRALLLRRASP